MVGVVRRGPGTTMEVSAARPDQAVSPPEEEEEEAITPDHRNPAHPITAAIRARGPAARDRMGAAPTAVGMTQEAEAVPARAQNRAEGAAPGPAKTR